MKEHAALVASLISAALIAGRLLSISRFDIGTAATILEVSGTGTAIAGTALTLLPFALVLVTCLLAIHLFVDDTFLNLGHQSGVGFGVAVGATACLAAIPLVGLTALFVLLTLMFGLYVRRSGEVFRISDAVAGSRLLRIQAAALAALTALAPIVLQRPWLPTQAISLRGDEVMVGYVLGEAQGRVAVMRDSDRTVHFLSPQEIRKREICSGPPATGGAVASVPQVTLHGSLLGALLWGDQVPKYPPCPSTGG